MSDIQSVPDLARALEDRFEQLAEPFNRFVSSQTSGAIIVIALFYPENLQLNMLWIAAGRFGTFLLINHLGIRHPLPD